MNNAILNINRHIAKIKIKDKSHAVPYNTFQNYEIVIFKTILYYNNAILYYKRGDNWFDWFYPTLLV